jgi:hypothetical protein
MVVESNEVPVSWLISIYNTSMNLAREEIIIYNWSRAKSIKIVAQSVAFFQEQK